MTKNISHILGIFIAFIIGGATTYALVQIFNNENECIICDTLQEDSERKIIEDCEKESKTPEETESIELIRTQNSFTNENWLIKTMRVGDYEVEFEIPIEWKERYKSNDTNPLHNVYNINNKATYVAGHTKPGMKDDNISALFSLTNYPKQVTYTYFEESERETSKWTSVNINGKEYDTEYYVRGEGGPGGGGGAGNYLVKLEEDLYVSAEFFFSWRHDCPETSDESFEGCAESEWINYTESSSSDEDLQKAFKVIGSMSWKKEK